MKNLKLISLRIDCDTLAAIEKVTMESGIKKRSWVINNMLRACVKCSTPQGLRKLATEFNPFNKGYTLEYRIDRDKFYFQHFDND